MECIVLMELVSIIVPIYNAECFLKKCIESILNQTYERIQLILVDDGSKDKSLEICEEYASKYKFIELYHKENGGVSSARNEGIKHIKGKYTFFVDADDYILPHFIENFMKIEECPFVGGGYCENPLDGWKLQFQNCVLTMEEYRRNCRAYLGKVPSVHVTGNRYLSSVILENNLKFNPESICGEDVKFNTEYFMHIDKLIVVDKCEYVYVIHSASAMHQFWPERLQEEKEECMLREGLFGKCKDFPWVKYIHWSIALEHLYKYTKAKNSNSRLAKRKLKEAIWDPYFRECMRYALKDGTLDMKIAVVCLKFGAFGLYKKILYLICKIKRSRIYRNFKGNI